ncbi:hypothetical protein [uncultured Roseovarius sp.]|uniref:hypothetical protein n=1 Tax=uncultured Roseovarius sp. TaxID=293344 RepID=UPI0026284FF9|nr:hypothetical protein [uncultured Roseovarius sp.]
MVFTVMSGVAGMTLLFVLVVLLREIWMPPKERCKAQLHCREEAARLLHSGAPDEKIEEWIVAAECPLAAKKKCNDGLPGYGLAF